MFDVNVYLVSAFVTARKRSLGQGNMFTGVCLSTWGGVPDQVHPPGPGIPQEQTPQSRHPPGADIPQSRHPLEQTPPKAATPWEHTPPPEQTPWEHTPPPKQSPPGADTPQSRHSPEQTPPSTEHAGSREIRWTRGRYASYWNAILFVKYVGICDLKLVTKNCNMTVQSGKYCETLKTTATLLVKTVDGGFRIEMIKFTLL